MAPTRSSISSSSSTRLARVVSLRNAAHAHAQSHYGARSSSVHHPSVLGSRRCIHSTADRALWVVVHESDVVVPTQCCQPIIQTGDGARMHTQNQTRYDGLKSGCRRRWRRYYPGWNSASRAHRVEANRQDEGTGWPEGCARVGVDAAEERRGHGHRPLLHRVRLLQLLLLEQHRRQVVHQLGRLLVLRPARGVHLRWRGGGRQSRVGSRLEAAAGVCPPPRTAAACRCAT
jgi:hypothetical protein